MSTPFSFPLSNTFYNFANASGSFSKDLYKNAFRTNSWKTLLSEDPRELPEEFVFSLDPVVAEVQPTEKLFSIDILLNNEPGPSVKRESAAAAVPVESPHTNFLASSPRMDESRKEKMEKFPADKVTDFKHVIYNLLVDGYNSANPAKNVVCPITVDVGGQTRTGFQFNEDLDPEKRIPELYGQHIHQSRLDQENQNSPFIQDLYKFYLRAGVELLGKYFEKYGKYTFLYDDDAPLFVPNGNLREAEQRIKNMRTRARKRERESLENGTATKRKATSRKVPYYVKCGLKL